MNYNLMSLHSELVQIRPALSDRDIYSGMHTAYVCTAQLTWTIHDNMNQVCMSVLYFQTQPLAAKSANVVMLC